MLRTSRNVLVAVAGLVLGGSGTLLGQAVAEIQIAPPNVSVAAGARTSVFATAYAANGNVVPIERLRWTSSNTQVVRVEVDSTAPDVAVIVGVTPGSAIVEASVGSRKGVLTVEVKGAGAASRQPPIVSTGGAALLKVDPGVLYMLPAEAARLTPQFFTADGTPTTSLPVTWKSLLSSVASVDPDGQVVAIGPGQGLIEVAGPGGLVARVPVQVSNSGLAVIRRSQGGLMSPGLTDTLVVMVPDQNQRRLPASTLQWRSTNESVVRVTPFGVVTAVNGGTAEIVITGFLQEIRAPVTVHRAIEFLSLSPPARLDTVRISLGGSMRFIAQPQASDGSNVPEAQVRFTMLDTSVVGFDPSTGIATPKRMGVTRLRVGVPGSSLDTAWTISVIAGTIGLNTHRLGISPGERSRVPAAFIDDAGRAFGTATGLRWSTSAPTVATVDNDGNIMGVGSGQALVTATTTWAKTDTVRVFVQNELLVVSNRTATPAGGADIYAVSRSAPTNFVRLTNNPSSDIAPSYSPDGTTIVFVSTRSAGNNQDIYTMDADGSNVRRITTSAAQEDSPRWTADAKHIVYASNATGAFQIWIMNADGTEARQLTTGTTFNSQPAVSPDGKTIAFTSTRDGNYEIYLMDITGANQRNFTKSPLMEQWPVWFPDGKLAFIQEQKLGTAKNAPTGRIAMKEGLPGAPPTPLTPTDITVSDFAVSRDGDMLAIIASSQARGGVFNSKLVLLPTAPGGVRVIVPLADAQEQVFAPSFRR